MFLDKYVFQKKGGRLTKIKSGRNQTEIQQPDMENKPYWIGERPKQTIGLQRWLCRNPFLDSE